MRNLAYVIMSLLVAMMLVMAGCGDGSEPTPLSLSDYETPSTSTTSTTTTTTTKQVELAVSELAFFGSSINSAQHPVWVYYTDPASNLWYISPIGSGKRPVYSLGAISSTGTASWRTVGANAAVINTVKDTVTIDPNIDLFSSDTYYDAGLKIYVTDSYIHYPRQKIQGTTVPIKWYFFKAQNGKWYIVNAPSYCTNTTVERFSYINGQYDWPAVDMTGRNAFYSSISIGFVPFDKFITDISGHKIDMDGSFGAQCVDLMRAYIDNALGVKYLAYTDSLGVAYPGQGFTSSDRTAYNIYNEAPFVTVKHSDLFKTNVRFVQIAYGTAVPKKGDIIFWKPTATGGNGHVGIFIEGDENRFTSFDQNWPVGSSAARVEHQYTGPTSDGLSGVAGWLHPYFE